MSYTYIFRAPVKFGLKFMVIISSISIDSEWEFSDNIICEINCILLCIPLKNFQNFNSHYIIN